jgi:alkylation response protein AidB-like acyl-CoA dehydrogenase
MDFALPPTVAELRHRLRRLIDENLPDDYVGPFHDDKAVETTRSFVRLLAERHLLTIGWPEEWGGSAASVWDQTALREEMWAHDEPRGAQYMGLSWVGPAIMRFGTDEQKRLHLPRIGGGEVTWAQGFSEPDAGSDLASLRLRATPTGAGGWTLNGQKIWTSYAGLAQYCFVAARTSSDGNKHHGITIFLIPTDRPGVTVRPIDSMLGMHHLNEVFFDDVEAHAADVLGPVDGGWDVIKAVLSFERVGIPRYARSDRLLASLWPLIDARPERDRLRADHARALVRCRVARLLTYRVIAAHDDGEVPDVEPALARIASTTLDQEVAELAMEVVGPDALDDDPSLPLRGRTEDIWRYARASTVAAGTIDIQRILVGRGLMEDI